MKRIVVTILVLLLANFVLAEEKKQTQFNYGISGLGYATNYQSIQKGTKGAYSAFRIQPFFSYSNGAVETMLKLEIDQLFGTQGGTKTDEDVTIGSDKRIIEVKDAYVKFEVEKVKGLSLIAGVAGYDYPLVLGDDVPLFSATYDFGKGSFTLGYIKVAEGGVANNADDAEIYLLDLAIKTDLISVRPALFLYDVHNQAAFGQYKKSMGIIPAINLSLGLDKLTIDTTFAMASGKDKTVTPNKEYNGYAFDFAVNYKATDSLTVGAFFTLLSGDKPDTADKDESFIHATIDGTGSGINLWRLFILDDAGSFTTNSDVASAGKYGNTAGAMIFGAVVSGSFGDFSFKLQGAYAQAAQKPTNTHDKKDMGIEIDLNLGYAVAKDTTLFFEMGYLKVGEAYKATFAETQNALYTSLGVSFAY